MRNTTEHTTETSPADLIPLAHLVLEGLAASIDVLAEAVGEDVVLDDLGRRSTTREVARRLFAERAVEEEQAETVRRRNQEKLALTAAEAQASIGRGVPVPAGLEHVGAVQLLSADAKAARLDSAGDRFDELASGDSFYHPLQQEEEEEEEEE